MSSAWIKTVNVIYVAAAVAAGWLHHRAGLSFVSAVCKNLDRSCDSQLFKVTLGHCNVTNQ